MDLDLWWSQIHKPIADWSKKLESSYKYSTFPKNITVQIFFISNFFLGIDLKDDTLKEYFLLMI